MDHSQVDQKKTWPLRVLGDAASDQLSSWEMIENGRACLDIAQQLHAVERAVANAKRTLIHDHIDHCLEQTVGPMSRGARRPLEEFKEITKYL